MIINIHGAKCIGIEAIRVTVEVDISLGIGIHLVGLADAAVKESLLRTMTALQAVGLRIPGKKIVINLAPADLQKQGSGYDLPIALGIIAASGQIELPRLGNFVIMGELGLDASVRRVQGALPIVEMAGKEGFAGCILPIESAMEAMDLNNVLIYGVRNLEEVLSILKGEDRKDLIAGRRIGLMHTEEKDDPQITDNYMDFYEIIGQETAKRGLEIAAAGGHNVIMIGAPGSGKSSLAKAMAGILPPMTKEESLITSKIYSVAGKNFNRKGLMRVRPFRCPHYSASTAAIIGGGNGDNILPGEVSLAQNGILFLDEFSQIPRSVSESLRAPIEDRKVVISRLRTKIEYPSSFMLVAATNPCLCGYYGEKDRCRCTPSQRVNYLSRLSGPIMDRIDVQLWLHPVETQKLVNVERGERSETVAARVAAARAIQTGRFSGEGIFTNAEMTGRLMSIHCHLSRHCKQLMEKIINNMGLSARAYTRVLKIARTIADLDDVSDISESHLAEAANYRFLDKPLY